MAEVQPQTPEIYRVAAEGGWTDFGILTGVTDRKAVQVGWGPTRHVKIQNPFWAPGAEGVTGNQWDLLIGNAQYQVIELTPGNTAEFFSDRLEKLWVRRQIGFTAAEPNHDPIDVKWYCNYDAPINLNPYLQNIPQLGLRLEYEQNKQAFFDDLFRTFQQLYSNRAVNK